jgi:hypothetical protein
VEGIRRGIPEFGEGRGLEDDPYVPLPIRPATVVSLVLRLSPIGVPNPTTLVRVGDSSSLCSFLVDCSASLCIPLLLLSLVADLCKRGVIDAGAREGVAKWVRESCVGAELSLSLIKLTSSRFKDDCETGDLMVEGEAV